MRQAGVLAAPGLIALGICAFAWQKTTEGRANWPKALRIWGGVDMETVQTNIIRFQVPMAAEKFVARLAERGVLANPTGPDSIRFVTHYQVSDEDVEAVLSVCRDIFREEAQGR